MVGSFRGGVAGSRPRRRLLSTGRPRAGAVWYPVVLLALAAGAGWAGAADVPFAPESALDLGTIVGSKNARAADLDGDGDLDILGGAEAPLFASWYENVGGSGASWSRHTIGSDPARSGAGVWPGDVDGDGDLDVLVATRWDRQIDWYENTTGAATSWTRRPIYTRPAGPADQASFVLGADVDGDGDLDVVSGFLSGGAEVLWHENTTGAGTAWTHRSITTAASWPKGLWPQDVDRDGDLDIVTASMLDNEIAWYENVGGSGLAWTQHLISTGAVSAFAVVSGDVDRDGDPDVLSASSGRITFHENAAGDGSTWTERTIASSSLSAADIFAADLDLDGDLDVLSATPANNTIAW